MVPSPSPTSPLPSPAPFAGQVSNPGGLGNTRSDFDLARGPSTAQTTQNLLVYSKNSLEYHVAFVPDVNGRAAFVVQLSQQSAQPRPLAEAQAQAHSLLPKDAQPSNPPVEANDQFAVERYTSQVMAQALPASVFIANGGEPGQLLAVYVKNVQGQVARTVVGAGNDPSAVMAQGR
jgi:hypothetical protein